MQLFRAEPVCCTRTSDPEGAHRLPGFVDKRKPLFVHFSMHTRHIVSLDVELEIRVFQMVRIRSAVQRGRRSQIRVGWEGTA